MVCAYFLLTVLSESVFCVNTAGFESFAPSSYGWLLLYLTLSMSGLLVVIEFLRSGSRLFVCVNAAMLAA